MSHYTRQLQKHMSIRDDKWATLTSSLNNYFINSYVPTYEIAKDSEQLLLTKPIGLYNN